MAGDDTYSDTHMLQTSSHTHTHVEQRLKQVTLVSKKMAAHSGGMIETGK